MLEKIKNVWKVILSSVSFLVLIMTVIDYFLKWEIWIFILKLLNKTLLLLYANFFHVIEIVWIFSITIIILRLYIKIKNSKTTNIEKQIIDNKNNFDAQCKKNQEILISKIKDIETKINLRLDETEMTLVDFEIEAYRSKGQIGEISMMLKKLNMVVKRGFGIEDTLLEIKEYIKRSGIPTFYLIDLHNSLQKVPDRLKLIKEEITKIAQEKSYIQQ